jgi:hypothetical protein
MKHLKLNKDELFSLPLRDSDYTHQPETLSRRPEPKRKTMTAVAEIDDGQIEAWQPKKAAA